MQRKGPCNNINWHDCSYELWIYETLANLPASPMSPPQNLSMTKHQDVSSTTENLSQVWQGFCQPPKIGQGPCKDVDPRTAALLATSMHQLWEWPGQVHSLCLDWLVQQHRPQSQAHQHQKHQVTCPNSCISTEVSS